MEFLTNGLLILNVVIYYWVTYRVGWSVDDLPGLSEQNIVLRRKTAKTYYACLSAQFLALFLVVSHILCVNVLRLPAEWTICFLALAVALTLGLAYLFLVRGIPSVEVLR